jgi:DNA polymerase-3 subunit beta
MRITCAKDHLVERLGTAARAASARASIQAASGVRIDAADGERPAELAATDLELSLRVPLECEVEDPGAVVLPARLAQEIVRVLPADRVTIESDTADGRVRIACGGGEYLLHTHPLDDFPRLPDIDPERVFSLDRGVFWGTAELVQRAASRDESRPVLTGILVHFEPDRLTMAATDSYRMAVKETRLEHPVPEPLEAIVPSRAIAELGRLVPGGSEPLEVLVERNHVAFGIDGVWLTARRIEGQFPNFRQLKPDTFEHDVALPREELADVVRRVGIFARHNAPIRLSFSNGEVRVAASTPDLGEAHETIPAPFAGDGIEIGFNGDFLRDGVETVPGDEVHLHLITPLRPALLSAGTDDFWYLIMPIRLAQ